MFIFFIRSKKYFILLISSDVKVRIKVIFNIYYIVNIYSEVLFFHRVLKIRTLSRNPMKNENKKSVSDGYQKYFS